MTNLAVTSVARGSVSKLVLRCLLFTLLGLFALYYLMPLFVMLTTSLKSLEEIRTGSLISLPREVTFDAWATAWSSACSGIKCEGLKPYFWNSITMAVPAVAISTFIGAINGYVIAQWRFRGANLIFSLRAAGIALLESNDRAFAVVTVEQRLLAWGDSSHGGTIPNATQHELRIVNRSLREEA